MLDDDWESIDNKDGILELQLDELETISSGALADDEDEESSPEPFYIRDFPPAIKCSMGLESADQQNQPKYYPYDEYVLLDAVDSGDLYAVHEVLLSGKFYIDQGDEEDFITPLMRAVRSNNIHMTLMLLSKGAHPHESSKDGDNAISDAMRLGHYQILHLLCLVQSEQIQSIHYFLDNNQFHFTINYPQPWFLVQIISYLPGTCPR